MTEDSRYNCKVNLTGNTVTAGGENSYMKSMGILVVPFGVKKRFWFRRLKVASGSFLVFQNIYNYVSKITLYTIGLKLQFEM